MRSLLQKLAPPSIEAELESPRKAQGQDRHAPAVVAVQGALWDVYTEVYGDFAEDEKQAFALIFGPEFAHAYSELAGDAAPAPPQALSPAAFPQPGQRTYSQPQAPSSRGAAGPRPFAAWTGPWPQGGPPRDW